MIKMENKSELEILKAWALKMQSVYREISKQIETLIVLLNESSTNKNDKDTKALAVHLLRVLKEFEERELGEAGIAKEVNSSQAKQVLKLLHAQLEEIKELKRYIQFSERNPDSEVIKNINRLHRLIAQSIALEVKVV